MRVHLPTTEADFIFAEARPGEMYHSPPGEGRAVALYADELKVRRTVLGGSVGDRTPIDADLDALRASGSVTPHELTLDMSTVATVRRVLALPVKFDIDASGTLPLGDSVEPVERLRRGRARVRAEIGEYTECSPLG